MTESFEHDSHRVILDSEGWPIPEQFDTDDEFEQAVEAVRQRNEP